MTKFYDTDAADAFIATAESRQTSPEIMRAIAFHARDLAEAEAIWEDGVIPGTTVEATQLAIWETATKNGLLDVSLCWGADGDRWANGLKAENQEG